MTKSAPCCVGENRGEGRRLSLETVIKKHVGLREAEELWMRERRCQSKGERKCLLQSKAAIAAYAAIS
jgi:hypothetical protein